MKSIELGQLVTPATTQRAGSTEYQVLSMTMHDGLVAQTERFKKRIASLDTSTYKVVRRGQLVVGFPINEGVLDFQSQYEAAVVSPAYGIWDVRDESLVDRDYLKRYLKSPRAIEYYEGKMKGSTARRRSLPAAEFDAMPIPLPPLPEQRRIAAILDHADALRAKRRQVLTHLDALTQSIFSDMFATADFPFRRLDELIDEGDRMNYGVVQPGDATAEGVPLIRVSDLIGGAVDRTRLKHIAPEVERAYARSRLRGNEILVSSVGSIGTVSLVRPADVGSNIARAITRVPIADEVLRTYVAAYLRTPEPQRYFVAELRTVAQPTLNVGQLAATRIPIPPAELQALFTTRLQAVQKYAQVVLSSCGRHDELFASLQTRAFRGEL